MRGLLKRYLCAGVIGLFLGAAVMTAVPSTVHAGGGGGAELKRRVLLAPPVVQSVYIIAVVYHLLVTKYLQAAVLSHIPVNVLVSALATGDPGAFSGTGDAKGPSMEVAGDRHRVQRTGDSSFALVPPKEDSDEGSDSSDLADITVLRTQFRF